MNRYLFVWALLLFILLPVGARAGTPYSIVWAMLQENPKCETAALLDHDGDPFFGVNGTPLPGNEVPGAFSKNPDGTESNLVETGFDSVLLRWGNNGFTFNVRNVGGHDECVHQQNLVTLLSPQLGIEKVLFNVRRDGTAYAGATELEMSLAEINPPLAKDIVNLEAEIAAERKWLIEHAAEAEGLAARLDMLQQLQTELNDLVTRPLDEISEVDLDEILNRYSSVVDEATREALQQLLADLKKSVQDLKDELASLMAEFGAQADSLVDLAAGQAKANGFDPDDPSNYWLMPEEAAWVEVPDVSGVTGAFDPGNDPYDTYANAVLEALGGFVTNGKVTSRMSFIANVRAWRQNQKALEKALMERVSVSQAETNAFLNAQNKVTSFVKQYMDAADWFLDSPVPADVRAQVDGVLRNAYGAMVDELKDALNALDNSNVNPELSMLCENIRAFSGAVGELTDVVMPYVEVFGAITHAATRVGLGFVPVVGPALDLCEAVTGKEMCLPDGRELTTGERVFSGIGFGGPKIFAAWKGIAKAPISAGGKAVAAGILGLGDELTQWLTKSRITAWKNGVLKLKHGGVAFEHEFEKTAALYLMKQQGHQMLAPGDPIVRSLLGIPKRSHIKGLAQACDLLTISKDGRIVLSEAKFVENLEGGLKTWDAIDQLRNVLNNLIQRGLKNDVELLQIITNKPARLRSPPDAKYIMKDGKLFDAKAGAFVQIEGFFVHIVEL